MTETMCKQITDLRLKGLGYKSIALVVGTSKENVRYYCKKHGLSGSANLVQMNYEEHKKQPDVCKQCGVKFERNRFSGKKLFCSDKCRKAWWYAHPQESNRSRSATYECECNYCKRIFYSYGNAHRKYCSHDCYIQDRFWTDDNVSVDENEIVRRQEISGKQPVPMTIKKIS